ncbi:hypothetical protein [Nereida sp. MMG025]|uniref:hypothetical protein n=1 Tax=Nereida sp. MMG025 TaxID=2909981 RepID=UPI001F215A7D|nr:hypothetical protein [Nereida sp. MMG025]MCF6443878.1 hypothetical protein [Nereida sp. MMG025]
MSTWDEFQSHEICKKGGTSKALDTFCEIVPDFRELAHLRPSEYVSEVWSRYTSLENPNRDINGLVFEYTLISLLMNKGLLPIYVQARVAFVPNVNFDLLLYTKQKPVVISAKTSLRERYKQADLEAIALKYVHRKADSYLLTLNEKESASVNRKIQTGDVIGLNKVILATSPDIDDLLDTLGELDFVEAGTIDIVTASSIIAPKV